MKTIEAEWKIAFNEDLDHKETKKEREERGSFVQKFGTLMGKEASNIHWDC